MSVEYGADQIQILEGLEAVRKRPGMYIGSTSSRGLHHLVYEIVDNSVDEALAGFCDSIIVTINPDNSVTVIDNGRGIPVGINHKAGIPAVEVVFTILHAGGKFGGSGYKVSGGLHGVGVSVVNALSNWLNLRIWREGKEHLVKFARGNVTQHLEVVGDSNGRHGTEVTFLPSKETFSTIEFSFETLERAIREKAFLNSGVYLKLIDNRGAEPREVDFHYEGGLMAFVTHLNKSKAPLHETVIAFGGEKDDIQVDVALQWTNAYNESMLCFTNNIPQKDGGTSLNRLTDDFITQQEVADGIKEALGFLSSLLSVKSSDVSFSEIEVTVVLTDDGKLESLHYYYVMDVKKLELSVATGTGAGYVDATYNNFVY